MTGVVLVVVVVEKTKGGVAVEGVVGMTAAVLSSKAEEEEDSLWLL